jgi:RNA polymerase sigma-70 factor (sigma-E family)
MVRVVRRVWKVSDPDRTGRAVTFEEFVTSRTGVLLRTAVALSGDLGLAEDLVQDVLIKVHDRWEHISALAAPYGYVRRMLVNEFLSWRRKWARVVPAADIAMKDAHPDHAGAVVDRRVLRDEIRRLPRRQQVVIVLRYYNGLTDADIADSMSCPVGTVRSLASRALSALRVDPTLQSEFSSSLPPLDHGMVRSDQD